MAVQYIIGDPRQKLFKNTRRLQSRQSQSFQLQPSHNNDILPGILDLPNLLPVQQVEKYLKIWALFFDRIIIPDGWLHCSGPIVRYLRHHLRNSRLPLEHKDRRPFLANTFMRLLREGIIVPALRGQRPTSEDLKVRGFRLYDVWTGTAQSRDPNNRYFGVYKATSETRMTILDPTPAKEESEEQNWVEENHTILKALQDATAVFCDWTAPHLAVDAIDVNDQTQVQLWDNELAAQIRDFATNNEITGALLELELNRAEGVDVKAVKGFAANFYASLAEEAHGKGIRRGTVENLIGLQIIGRRVRDYVEFDDLTTEPAIHCGIDKLAVVAGAAARPISPRRQIARWALVLATTVQETSYADRFHCSLNIPPFFEDGIYHGKLAQGHNLASDIDSFIPQEHTLAATPIPFDEIEIDDVLELRQRRTHLGLMEAQSTCRCEPSFVDFNKKYFDRFAEFLRLCNQAAPVRTVATKIAIAGVRLVVKHTSAELLIDGGDALMRWMTAKTNELATETIREKLGPDLWKVFSEYYRDQRFASALAQLTSGSKRYNDRRIEAN